MIISFFRTIFLYILVVAAFRIMGKRQIGELQPSELAVAIMISELASIPMQETNVPLLNGVIPILTLIVAEVFLSFIVLKSKRARDIIGGVPSILIHKGKINEKELKKLRFNIDDLLEDLRIQNYPNIYDVEFAILETNGQLSIIPKADKAALTPFDMNLSPKQSELPYTLISDGKIDYDALKSSGKNENWLKKQLENNKIESEKDVFYMSICGDSIFLQKFNKERDLNKK